LKLIRTTKIIAEVITRVLTRGYRDASGTLNAGDYLKCWRRHSPDRSLCHHHGLSSAEQYAEIHTPTRFALVLATEPVFAGITGYWWGGEVLSTSALAGAVLTLIAMLMAVLSRLE